jgi:hypothetical protein
MDDDPLTRRTEWRGDRDDPYGERRDPYGERGDPYLDAPESDRARLSAGRGADDYVPPRGTPALTMVAVVILAAVALGIGIAFGTGLLTPPWVAAEPSLTPGASPTPVASPSPSPGSPTPAPTPATPGGLAPDSLVQVTVDRLTLRSDPGLAGQAMWVLPAGMPGFVISGPVQTDGYDWYQLSGLGLPYGSGCVTPEPGGVLECPAWLGWLAAGDPDGTAWLAPAEAPPCPEEPVSVVSLSELQYTLRLVCFGADALTFVAWWPDEPVAGAVGGCPAADSDVAWLACQETNPNGLAADPSESAGRLMVSVDPAAGPAMPERGQWIELTGHFDDPAAQGCAEVAELRDSDPAAEVFTCRLQFVVTAVSPATAP